MLLGFAIKQWRMLEVQKENCYLVMIKTKHFSETLHLFIQEMDLSRVSSRGKLLVRFAAAKDLYSVMSHATIIC